MSRTTIPDKREGACRTGPCRIPRRCWQYETCFLYGEGTKRVEGSEPATRTAPRSCGPTGRFALTVNPNCSPRR